MTVPNFIKARRDLESARLNLDSANRTLDERRAAWQRLDVFRREEVAELREKQEPTTRFVATAFDNMVQEAGMALREASIAYESARVASVAAASILDALLRGDEIDELGLLK